MRLALSNSVKDKKPHLTNKTNDKRPSISTEINDIEAKSSGISAQKERSNGASRDNSPLKHNCSGDNALLRIQNSATKSPNKLDSVLRNTYISKELNIDFNSNSFRFSLNQSKSMLDRYDKSKNIFHYFTNLTLGRLSHIKKQEIQGTKLSTRLEDFEVVDEASSFSSRVTAIEWHPRQFYTFAVGSKHGDIVFHNIDHNSMSTKCLSLKNSIIEGSGPGGSISALKWHPSDDEKFFTSALCGKVVQWNANSGQEELTLLNTHTWDFWYCALDVHRHEDLVVSGKNDGEVHLQDRQGNKIWDKVLHKGKVTHTEFSPCNPALLCTASIDHTVKLWDMRKMTSVNFRGKEKYQPLVCLNFDKGVNAACFSSTDGCRLLTTDQGSSISVFRAPFWQKETDISHPHRCFQHITPIKAAWHPCEDLIVCGRFPDRNFPELGDQRVVDIMDANTGKMVAELKDIRYNKIVSLSKFNKTGEKLLTTMSSGIQVWSNKYLTKEGIRSEIENDQLDQGGCVLNSRSKDILKEKHVDDDNNKKSNGIGMKQSRINKNLSSKLKSKMQMASNKEDKSTIKRKLNSKQSAKDPKAKDKDEKKKKFH